MFCNHRHINLTSPHRLTLPRLQANKAAYYPATGPVTNPAAEPRWVLSQSPHARFMWNRNIFNLECRFLEMVKMNFDTAAKHTGISVGMLEVIKACNSLLRVNFPLRRDDGRYEQQLTGRAVLHFFLWKFKSLKPQNISLCLSCNKALR